jgi:hypothetical protein
MSKKSQNKIGLYSPCQKNMLSYGFWLKKHPQRSPRVANPLPLPKSNYRQPGYSWVVTQIPCFLYVVANHPTLAPPNRLHGAPWAIARLIQIMQCPDGTSRFSRHRCQTQAVGQSHHLGSRSPCSRSFGLPPAPLVSFVPTMLASSRGRPKTVATIPKKVIGRGNGPPPPSSARVPSATINDVEANNVIEQTGERYNFDPYVYVNVCQVGWYCLSLVFQLCSFSLHLVPTSYVNLFYDRAYLWSKHYCQDKN